MKLLIVEDNIELSENIQSYLAKEGSICETAFTYNQAIDKIISFAYDVIILDLMLKKELKRVFRSNVFYAKEIIVSDEKCHVYQLKLVDF